jgi:hypothetical protein
MIRSIVFAGLVTAAGVAHAEPLDDFGARGQLIISADRLMPLLSYTRVRVDQTGGDSTTTSTTSFALLWSSSPQDFYDVPRAGVDYVVAPHVTVGGMLFGTLPASATRSSTQNGTTTSRDAAKLSAFGIGARAGYVVPLTPRIAFWGRGGLSYARESTTSPQGNMGNTTNESVSQLGLNLEPLFVFLLAPHLGVQAGPVLDVPLSGTDHTEFTTNNGMTVSQDNDTSQLHFGLTVGLFGYL